MLGSVLFCFVLLVFSLIIIFYLREKASTEDQIKLSDEIDTDFEDDLLGDNKDRRIENLVEWIEK